MTSTTHTGSDEIGLEEKIKFKGTAEFTFNDIPEPEIAKIELTEVKKKTIIKAEIRDGRKSKNRDKSSNLF
jgi:hypothetical protein